MLINHQNVRQVLRNDRSEPLMTNRNLEQKGDHLKAGAQEFGLGSFPTATVKQAIQIEVQEILI